MKDLLKNILIKKNKKQKNQITSKILAEQKNKNQIVA
jgi:hypothetical protein